MTPLTPTPFVARIFRSRILALATLALSLVTCGPTVAAPRGALPVPRSAIGADSLVTSYAPSPARLAAFRGWAKPAPLEDLMFVLRRESVALGELELPALESALARTPVERSELRARLSARRALAAERRGKRAEDPIAAATANAPHSAYRVGLVIPSDGDHVDDAEDLSLAFGLGVSSRMPPSRPPVEFVVARSGHEDPAAVAAAFDSVERSVALVCGGFTLASAQVLAAASRWSGIPVLLPLVDDPVVSRLAERSWSIGPTAEERGRVLAGAMKIGPGDRVIAITSNAADTAFTGAFAGACRGRGATFVTRFGYAAGNASFAAEVRALITQRATVLFWNGDASEAAPLLRQLTRDRVSLRICGGDGLDPTRHHRETRVLLEGILYAGEDWVLSEAALAELVSAMDAVQGGPPNALHVRGWLTGRVAGQALASGVLAPGEVAAALAKLVAKGASAVRMLAVQAEGAELPVFKVSEGRARPAQ